MKQEDQCCGELAQWLSPRLFKALSDPNRVALLARLGESRRDQSVSELARGFHIDLSVVSRHLGILRDAGIVSKASVAVSPDVHPKLYEQARNVEGIRLACSVEDALSKASAAVVCSGTATLETAMWGIPFIITYITSPLTYFLAKILVRGVEGIGMANIVTDSAIATELIQNEVCADNIVRCVTPLLTDTDARRNSLAGLKLVRTALGKNGSSGRAARYILEAADENP